MTEPDNGLLNWLVQECGVKNDKAEDLCAKFEGAGIDCIEQLQLRTSLEPSYLTSKGIPRMIQVMVASKLLDHYKLDTLTTANIRTIMREVFPEEPHYADEFYRNGINGFVLSTPVSVDQLMKWGNLSATHAGTLESLLAGWRKVGVNRSYLPSAKTVNPVVAARGGKRTLTNELNPTAGPVQKRLSAQGPLLTPGMFEERFSRSGPYIPDNGVCDLRIERPSLVHKIIQKAQMPDIKHCFVGGAAGVGKTILLMQIGRALEKQGKSVLIALNTQDLDSWYYSRDISLPEPDFLLVDDVHVNFNSSAVAHYAGKSIVPEKLVTCTIFAGAPSNTCASSILSNRMELTELLLDEKELLQANVVQFFLNKLRSTDPAAGLETKEVELKLARVEAVKRALCFARQYTSGHMYPCLKLTEFFVAHLSPEDVTEQNMVALLASPAFYGPVPTGDPKTVYQEIFTRCFSRLVANTEEIIQRCRTGSRFHPALANLGLWVDGWLMSPLLHLILAKMVPTVQLNTPDYVTAKQAVSVFSHC